MQPGAQPPTTPPVAPMVAPQAGSVVEDPGKTLGIVALVLTFVGLNLVALVLAIIANSKSKKAGFKNTIAKVAIWLNIILMVLTVVMIGFFVWLGANFAIRLNAEETERKNDSATITSAINTYYTDHHLLPSSLDDLDLSQDTKTDPNGKTYTYMPTPEGCEQSESCTGFMISSDRGYELNGQQMYTYTQELKQ